MTQYYSRKDTAFNGDVYDIPFSYIKESEIRVYIDDVLYPDWTFLNESQIKLTVMPSQAEIVSVRRETDISKKMVEFTNNTMMNKTALNMSQDQLLDAIQEFYDNNVVFNNEVVEYLGVLPEIIETCEQQTQLAVESAEAARNSEHNAFAAVEQAQDALAYGYTPHYFEPSNWIQEDELYVISFDDVPMVNGVYRDNEDSTFFKVCNIDIKQTDSGIKIYSMVPFKGFILETAQVHVTYTFSQDTETDLWSITHNLRHYPCVTIIDTGGTVTFGTIRHTSINALEIQFENPVAGKAILT